MNVEVLGFVDRVRCEARKETLLDVTNQGPIQCQEYAHYQVGEACLCEQHAALTLLVEALNAK